eukprot:9479725-Pyramimonas_sp.AAC.1
MRGRRRHEHDPIAHLVHDQVQRVIDSRSDLAAHVRNVIEDKQQGASLEGGLLESAALHSEAKAALSMLGAGRGNGQVAARARGVRPRPLVGGVEYVRLGEEPVVPVVQAHLRVS